MSEVNTNPEELVEEIEDEIDDAEVIPTPIDPTLSIEGEAADAAATGAAIQAVFSGAKVNNKNFVNKEVTLYGSDIKMSDEEGATTLKAAIEDAGGRTATDITYDTVDGAIVTVKQKVDGIVTEMNTGITNAELDEIVEEVFTEEDDE